MARATIHRDDAIWLAGLLDGEGCFDSPRGNPRIRVKMTDHGVVLRAAGIMGATTHMQFDPTPDVVFQTYGGRAYKPQMIAQTTGDNAVAVMTAVLPWLGARRTGRVTDILTARVLAKRTRVPLQRTAAAA